MAGSIQPVESLHQSDTSISFSEEQIICGNSVGAEIATGYGLDGRGVGVRVPVGSRIFSSPRRPNRFWGPPSLLPNVYRGLFPPRGKADHTFNYCRGQEYVDPYTHSPIRLHGVVLN
jgi:hypothetical protein